MSELICCLSDLHGTYGTMIRLLNQVARSHPGAKLVFLGDLVDRGPNSRAVVEFAINHSILTTCGNHEDLCLAYSAHKQRGYVAHCPMYYDRDVWLWNGGENALGNWPTYRKTDDGLRYQNGNRLPKKVLDWMALLPPYIIIDTKDENGLKLCVSHTGYGLEADNNTSIGWFGALWGRHPSEGPFPKDNYYRVYGHSRTDKPIVTSTYAQIDTGSAYGGGLTAFIWPTKETIYQRYDESVVEQEFKVNNGCISV